MQIKAFVHADKNFVTKKYEYKIYPFEETVGGSVMVCPVTIEIDLPAHFDAESQYKEQQVKAIRTQIEAKQKELQELESRLGKL